MKKFLKHILFFIPFAALFYIIMMFIWGNFAPIKLNKNFNYKLGSIGQMQLRLEEFHTVKDLDVLFIGPSTSYRGFDTRIFDEYGIKSFTLGSSAQTPIQTKYLLQRYLFEVDQNLLILDVNPLMFTIDGVESSLDLITNDDFNFNLVKMAFAVNNLKVYNTLIYAFYADKTNNNSDYKAPTIRENATYISGGFVEHELSFFQNIQYEEKNWNYVEKQFQVFEDIITMLKSNNINYIIVQSPIASSLYYSYLNNDKLDNFMIEQGRYYNFNKILSLKDSLHFFDASHLNTNGVDIYNRRLVQLLQSEGIRFNKEIR